MSDQNRRQTDRHKNIVGQRRKDCEVIVMDMMVALCAIGNADDDFPLMAAKVGALVGKIAAAAHAAGITQADVDRHAARQAAKGERSWGTARGADLLGPGIVSTGQGDRP